MDPRLLRNILIEINTSIIVSVFIAGLFSFFSPCILPLLPVYFGYFTADEENESDNNRKILIKLTKTLLFIAGISIVFFLLGFGAGVLGKFLSGTFFTVFCGILVFLFGLHYAGIINIPVLERQKTLNWSYRENGYLNVFILGIIFSFGWTPCIGPILASVLSITAQSGNAIIGGLLLLIYSLGLSIPFLILSIGTSFLFNKVQKLNQYLPLIKLIGGLLIALMGLWMIFSQVQVLEKSAKTSNQPLISQESLDQGEEFSLNSVNGDAIKLSDYRGKPVCIKFWGTWCPSCMAGLENFQELANEINSTEKASVLSIAAPGLKGEMDSSDFIDWVHSQNLTFPILLDEEAKVNKQFNLKAYPTYIFFDKNGNLAETKVGEIQEEELKSLLEELEN